MTTDKAQTLATVKERGLTSLDEPLQLASGFMSRHFIDAKAALCHGSDLATACRAMVELVGPDLPFDAVGGLTLGADQFAHGIAIIAPCDWFVIRKQTKGRGTNKRVEGATLDASQRVLLVDDIVTTGGSIQEAYDCVVATGAQVVAATTLADRGDIAAEFFDGKGVPYFPLMTYRNLGIPRVGDEGIADQDDSTPATA